MRVSERRRERKACGRKYVGNGARTQHQGACLVWSSVHGTLLFLQAAAEPVTVGSVRSSLYPAWRLPARGLTFPEVLSHSASRYSLWQVELDHSKRRQTWAEARRGLGGAGGLFQHKSPIFPAGGAEISRCVQEIGWGVNLAFVSGCHLLLPLLVPVRCEEWCEVEPGDRLTERKGIAATALRCQRSDCPKPNFTTDFLRRRSQEWHKFPRPGVKAEAWFTCHFAQSSVAAHHEGVRDRLLVQPVIWRLVGGFREKVTPLLNWRFSVSVKETRVEESQWLSHGDRAARTTRICSGSCFSSLYSAFIISLLFFFNTQNTLNEFTMSDRIYRPTPWNTCTLYSCLSVSKMSLKSVDGF